jgi:cytochrome c oxidase cbb3-type subunit 3
MSSDNHSYDGIEEHDNPLPLWWLVTFFATIIFAFLYFIHYSTGAGPNLAQELEIDMKALPAATEKIWTEAELEGPFGDKEKIMKGQAVFSAKCVACHGEHAQGIIGPNLTDNFWLHGGHKTDIVNVIKKGVTEKGMPTWGGVISDDETIQVAAYIFSLKGSNPPNPKPPQGEEVK